MCRVISARYPSERTGDRYTVFRLIVAVMTYAMPPGDGAVFDVADTVVQAPDDAISDMLEKQHKLMEQINVHQSREQPAKLVGLRRFVVEQV